MSPTFILLALIFSAFSVFLLVPAKELAEFLRTWFPGILAVIGVLLIFSRFGMFGSLTLFVAFKLWRRNSGSRPLSTPSSEPRESKVRTASLEMELDHDTGEMSGIVLAGTYEGANLAQLDEPELLVLRTEIHSDGESVALLDAYLDRRFPKWRENAKADVRARQAGATSSGAMSEQEAYEVLGLPAGASVTEIRQAHRRLMKSAHPDSGGSTFLASKINEAKDVLLRSHS